jgi:glycosyltransferase involved in cell wall biosynthesis
MRRVKVLYVAGSLDAGGTESQLLHLVRRLDRSRFDPELAIFEGGGALDADFEALCPVHLLPKRPLTEPKVFAALVRLMKTLPAGVVHTSLFSANWRGALAARAAGVPAVVGSVRNVGSWMGPVRRAVERAATSWADAVVVNAAAVARFMVEEVGARPDRIRVIANGVDVDSFRPRRDGDPDLRAGLWPAGGAEVVGAVMTLTAKKNPEDFVAAAARVAALRPAAKFLIAGEGPLRAEVASRIAGAGLAGRFLLLGLRRDVPDVLRALDLLVLPSAREGLPNVVLEAMATGLPVVATSVGGTPDLVLPGVTGLLVPPGDPGALASAILAVLGDPAAARRMGAEALRRVREAYSLDGMVRRTEALYEELLAAAERSRGSAVARAGAAP